MLSKRTGGSNLKIFHLSDLHIGLKLFNRDLREDQEYILHEIANRAREEKPDVIVIAGDIYDKAVPSAESYEIFDRFTEELSEAVPEASIMMISGNHDSAPRINVLRSVLAKNNFYMIGNPPMREDEYIEKVVLSDEFGEVNFYLLPFVKPSMVKQIVGVDDNGNNLSYDESIRRLIAREDIDESVRNVFVSHQFYLPKGTNACDVERMDSEIKTVGNIDEVGADVLECFDYSALGHIHKPMKVGSEYYRYCGTPLACSVSEQGQDKGIVVVDMKEKGDIETSVISLKPLREVKVITGLLEDVLKQACEDYVTVVITDDKDLNVIDMKDRLRYAFPYLLEIRRDNIVSANYNTVIKSEKELDPFELCCSFVQGLKDDELMILKDVINTVQGV